MKTDDSYQKLMILALRALSRRAHTVHELREKFKKYKLNASIDLNDLSEYENTIDNVLQRLHELNYVNDEEYIKNAINISLQNKCKSLWAILPKLQKKGLEKQKIIDQWHQMNIDEEESAQILLAKIIKKYSNLDHNQLRQKIAQTLVRRGYSKNVSYKLAKIEQMD